jgi:hypothetical protein
MADSLAYVESLDWFPKKFTPGDMDAAVGERLLGATELSPLEVVVRETAQNSWDARREGVRPRFGVNLRQVDFRYRADLARLLTTNRGSSPVKSVAQDNPYILEIFDRGTSGLDGPASLRPTAVGEPANYQDLILKVGVPRSDGKGGGTYGFGKTAAFALSNSGTVVYWTRCKDPGGQIEDRFVASAFREAYTDMGVQYTGRHWWGERDDGQLMPVRGSQAAQLGQRFFSKGFEEGETGTSILVVDPKLTNETMGIDEDSGLWVPDASAMQLPQTAQQFAAAARHAIRVHLWPKLVARGDGDMPPMDIELDVCSQEIALIDEPRGAIELWASGLNAIRAVRGGNLSPRFTPYGLPISVFPILRKRQVLGHLALVRRVMALEPGPSILDDLDPINSGARLSRIALMRGQTELIVATVDWLSQSPTGGFEWLAVYKASDEFDAAYARTEPPAHDAWTSGTGSEEGLIVRATRLRSVEEIRKVLYPQEDGALESSVPINVGGLARRFAALLPSEFDGPGTASERSGHGRRRGSASSRKVQIEFERPRLMEMVPDGRQRQIVPFQISGTSEIVLVHLSLSVIGDEGANESVDLNAVDVTWTGAEPTSPGSALMPGGLGASVEFYGEPRRAYRVELNASTSP